MEFKRHETDEDVIIFDGSHVVGDVSFGGGCSVWYNVVVRADVQPIIIGNRVNIQDNTVLHTAEDAPLIIGDDVTIGHSAIVHCHSVGSGTLIGMGAILLSGAKVGSGCIIGAGALVTGKADIPDGSLAVGSPAKVVRKLTGEEKAALKESAEFYVKLSKKYR